MAYFWSILLAKSSKSLKSPQISKSSTDFQGDSSQEIRYAMKAFWSYSCCMFAVVVLLTRFNFLSGDIKFSSNTSWYIPPFMFPSKTYNALIILQKAAPYLDTPISALHCGYGVVGLIQHLLSMS